ncbi:hypothetical protein HU200_063606 [Digitaria exilis]|uniref:SAM domain-containing protein n=1 Tax=Digitaria exilis TaxID=1010633 RepID=A0A835A5W5_9POAL|nr:hypothetical protein HU200_063606 [Digitaria exilis]
MDWHAWLSGARLEPALVYEYALVLARNELEADDVAFFDHDLLHSMGISVAKHRLEILKLASRHRARHAPPPLGRRSLLGRLARFLRSLVRHRDEGLSSAIVLVPTHHHHHHAQGCPAATASVLPRQQQRRGNKALRRATSEPKGSTTHKVAFGGRAASAVHAVGDVEDADGGSDEMVRWDRLFRDLKPN